MARRRGAYALLLAAALLFHLFDIGYLACFLLALALTLPVLGMLLSLPAMLRCRLELQAEPTGVERGGEAGWRLAAHGPVRLPLAQVTIRLRMENALTGGKETRRVTLTGPEEVRSAVLRADASHCGRLTCRVERARVCDCMGLFTLPLRPPAPASLLVLPQAGAPVPPDLPGEGSSPSGALAPRPGGGPGEDYDLRPYRPGDPIRTVHWKLTSKRDELVVRETLEPRRSEAVLTFDHFGRPEEMDRVLDRLNACSLALLERGEANWVRWAHPVSGQVRDYPVSDRRSLSVCLAAVLADPAPVEGRTLPPTRPETGMHRFHLEPGREEMP